MASSSTEFQRARSKTPDPLLAHIGSRLRDRRTLLGITTAQLGTACGSSSAQIERFESGLDRIAPIILSEIAQFLSVTIGYFYHSVPSPAEGRDHATVADLATFRAARQAMLASKTTTSHEVSEILGQIEDQTVRDCLIAFMQSLTAQPAVKVANPVTDYQRDGAVQNAINTQALFIRLADIGQGL